MLFNKNDGSATLEAVSKERMKNATSFITKSFGDGVDAFATTLYTSNINSMCTPVGQLYTFTKGMSIIRTASDIKYTSEVSKICQSSKLPDVDETEVYKAFGMKRIRKSLFDIGIGFLVPALVNAKIGRVLEESPKKSRFTSILYRSNLLATAGLFASAGGDFGVNKLESIIHTKKNNSSKLIADNYYLGKYHYSGSKRNSMFIEDRNNEFKNRLIGTITGNVIGAFIGNYTYKIKQTDELIPNIVDDGDVTIITFTPVENTKESKSNDSKTIKTSKKSSK